jgi:chemotaxis protein CheC
MNALTEFEQDALTEIFNIGVGVAAAALYEMTGRHVPVSVPVIEMTSQQLARQHFLDRESRQLCVIGQAYVGEFSTEAVLMFPAENRQHLVRMMVGNELPEAELEALAQDALGELGNIVLNAVISQLASSLSMHLEGSLPAVSVMDASAVFTRTMGGADTHDDAAPVLALMIDFELSAQRVGGYLAFLLDDDSSQKLLQRLAVHIRSSTSPS